MKYAGIIKNDFLAAPGVSSSFFVQGCGRQCPHCHNPETWDFQGGKEFKPEIINELVKALQANGINRSLSIQGGEPLCPENEFLTYLVITEVRKQLPEVPVYLWTGYTMEELNESGGIYAKQILQTIDVLVDGPYIHEQRDITLPMRGSRNQQIWQRKNNEWTIVEDLTSLK